MDAGLALLAAFSFIVGSVPFGLLFTRGSGVDITKTGSGNIGATNVLRSVGKKAAAMTLLADMLKGTAAVALVRVVMGPDMFREGLCGLMAVLGHDFSIFQGGKGGKGVATSLGVLFIYTPWAGLAAALTWLATFLAFRISSLGALMAFVAAPIAVYYFGYGWDALVISVIITLLLIYKHRTNIKNLINGTEKRIGHKA